MYSRRIPVVPIVDGNRFSYRRKQVLCLAARTDSLFASDVHPLAGLIQFVKSYNKITIFLVYTKTNMSR